MNNIFYKCEEAAIKMPTDKNEAQGNMYADMSGGYLRILYPAPECCLDLPAWQEFYGFDQEGQEGVFLIDVDTDNYTLKFMSVDKYPWENMLGRERHHYVMKIEDMKEVDKDVLVLNDFFGTEIPGNRCKPGPFSVLVNDKEYNIDPRRKS